MKKHLLIALVFIIAGATSFPSYSYSAIIPMTAQQCKAAKGNCKTGIVNNCSSDESEVGSGCFGAGNGACCIPLSVVCTNPTGTNGRVAGLKAQKATSCGANEKIAFSWNNSVCCVSTSPTPAPAPGGKPATTPPNSDAACATAKGTCNPTCPSGSTQNGTCTSGQCCIPSSGGAGGGTTGTPTLGAPITISFPPPTQYTTVDEFLTSVLGFARNIVVILALVFLVIGGLLYITSAGNDKRIGAAKAAITAALIGLAIVMVAPSFLKELGTVLGWDNSASLPSNTLTLTEIATNVLNFLLAIVGILAIIMFLVGAVMYFLSAGDEKRANTGKDIVKYAIIGIIVTFSALVIVRQIADFFQ